MNKPDVEVDLCIAIDQLVFPYYAVYTSSRRLKTGLRPNHQQEQRESSRQAGDGRAREWKQQHQDKGKLVPAPIEATVASTSGRAKSTFSYSRPKIFT